MDKFKYIYIYKFTHSTLMFLWFEIFGSWTFKNVGQIAKSPFKQGGCCNYTFKLSICKNQALELLKMLELDPQTYNSCKN